MRPDEWSRAFGDAMVRRCLGTVEGRLLVGEIRERWPDCSDWIEGRIAQAYRDDKAAVLITPDRFLKVAPP